MLKPIIALDADGVLLNYHVAYRNAWYKAFNQFPALKDSNAYWPIDRWEVRKLDGDELIHFRSFFNKKFWETIPAIDGAVEACNSLHAAGFELICVSALESKFENSRLKNLKTLGFPINRVFATSTTDERINPKAEVINSIKPIVFIDDFLPYYRGISQKIHKALILKEMNGSPNLGVELKEIDSTHTSLEMFSTWWLK